MQRGTRAGAKCAKGLGGGMRRAAMGAGLATCDAEAVCRVHC